MAISFFASLISPHESDDNQDWFLKFCLIDFCRMAQDCTNVSFVYRSVHALSENKLAAAQTDEMCASCLPPLSKSGEVTWDILFPHKQELMAVVITSCLQELYTKAFRPVVGSGVCLPVHHERHLQLLLLSPLPLPGGTSSDRRDLPPCGHILYPFRHI
jgi:hypothetical protein